MTAQHVWHSYVKGATPKNGYRMDPSDWERDVVRTLADDEDARMVFLHELGVCPVVTTRRAPRRTARAAAWGRDP